MEKSAPLKQGGGSMSFRINGIEWNIVWVHSSSANLRRSDGTITVGVTDFGTKCVYLSRALHGEFLKKVMAHELCHCFCFSYNIVMSVDEEERLADWIATYGEDLIYLLDDIMRTMLKKAYAM